MKPYKRTLYGSEGQLYFYNVLVIVITYSKIGITGQYTVILMLNK